MVAGIVNENLPFLTVFHAADKVTDTGLAGITRRQRRRVRQEGLQHFQRDYFRAVRQAHRLFRSHAEIGQHGKNVQIMIAKAHPKADGVGIYVLRQRVQFVMACKVYRAASYYREIIVHANGMNFLQLPLTLIPSPNLFKLPEIDLRIKVRGKILAMAAGIDIQNINGINGVEIFLLRQSTPGVNHARIKACA